MKAVLDLPQAHSRVLLALIKKLDPAETLWVLTGSAGLRLQGVDVPVNDLDLQTDAKTVYFLEQELAESMILPVHVWESPRMRSFHGKAEMGGVQVELLGDVRHRAPDGGWGDSFDITSVRIWVDWREVRVPALSLAHELIAYERMERFQKADLIRSVIMKDAS